jgi:hypothetical protein
MSNGSRGCLALAFLAVTVTGCETATGPDEGAFDARAALADYHALDAILASAGWRGFLAMGGAVSIPSVAPGAEFAVAGAQSLRVFRGAGDARSFAVRLAGAGASLHAASTPVISPLHRGRTLVYDAVLGRYVVDPDRTGAPATGVRLIVYQSVAGKPDPAHEIGYADLIDEGDASAEDIALRLVVVSGERTVLDYRTTLDESGGHGRITVDGFLRDEDDQLDFAIDVSGSEGALDVAFRMAVESRSFEIEGAVAGAQQGEGETGDIDVSVAHGGESFRVDLTGTPTSIGGTVYLNGNPFVEVSGHPDAPVFARPGGGALTQLERLVLYRVVDIVEDVFDLFDNLLDPIDELVILAVIL